MTPLPGLGKNGRLEWKIAPVGINSLIITQRTTEKTQRQRFQGISVILCANSVVLCAIYVVLCVEKRVQYILRKSAKSAGDAKKNPCHPRCLHPRSPRSIPSPILREILNKYPSSALSTSAFSAFHPLPHYGEKDRFSVVLYVEEKNSVYPAEICGRC
jgi:hypothetical protein